METWHSTYMTPVGGVDSRGQFAAAALVAERNSPAIIDTHIAVVTLSLNDAGESSRRSLPTERRSPRMAAKLSPRRMP